MNRSVTQQKQDKRVLAAIRENIDKHSKGPRLAVIVKMTKLDTKAVSRSVHRLTRMNAIKRKPRDYESIRIVTGHAARAVTARLIARPTTKVVKKALVFDDASVGARLLGRTHGLIHRENAAPSRASCEDCIDEVLALLVSKRERLNAAITALEATIRALEAAK